MTYRIFRTDEGRVALWRGTRPITPKHSQKVYNHSPDGFEFGYGGSGPAQLALAILLDFTGSVNLAARRYQTFKRVYIEPMQEPGGEISMEQIRAFLDI